MSFLDMKHPKNKVFLDSVHGHVYIPADYCKEIIDTPIFQRLRRIEQTSYRALYPSARHDRFIHSIGVYHVGSKISQGLKSNLKYSDSTLHDYIENLFKKGDCSGWDFLLKTYEIACLLHDCGHAPFSHTFEKYYVRDKSEIVDKIIECINDYRKGDSVSNWGYSDEDVNKLKLEIQSRTTSIKEHELTSAWLLIHKNGFRQVFVNRKLDPILAIRMIIGCKHLQQSDYAPETQFDFSVPEQISDKQQIENCFISLLNGHAIDADRLDYFARDSWATGLNTSIVNIDRLLSSLSIKKETNVNSQYVVCLDKRALTELKNIADVKEFQNYRIVHHHKVCYDNNVLIKAVTELANLLCDDDKTKNKTDSEQEKKSQENEKLYKLFSYQSLVESVPLKFKYNNKVYQEQFYLTSDDDIVYLLKKFFLSPGNKKANYAKEWLCRDYQVIPLWKSYVEFMDIFKEFQLDTKKTESLYHSVELSVASFLKNQQEKKPTLNFNFTKPLLKKMIAYPFFIDKESDEKPLYINIGDGEDVTKYSDAPYLTGMSNKLSETILCTNEQCEHTSKICTKVYENQDSSRYWNYFYLFLPKIYEKGTEISKDDYNLLYKKELKKRLIEDYRKSITK